MMIMTAAEAKLACAVVVVKRLREEEEALEKCRSALQAQLRALAQEEVELRVRLNSSGILSNTPACIVGASETEHVYMFQNEVEMQQTRKIETARGHIYTRIYAGSSGEAGRQRQRQRQRDVEVRSTGTAYPRNPFNESTDEEERESEDHNQDEEEYEDGRGSGSRSEAELDAEVEHEDEDEDIDLILPEEESRKRMMAVLMADLELELVEL